MLKPQVHAALTRLKAFLESRGAQFLLIYLPVDPSGRKTGVDDYLVAGHSMDELLDLATPNLRSPPRRRKMNTTNRIVRRSPGCYGTNPPKMATSPYC